MNSKTTLTMVIALVAMIGMTGLAVADSTMVYDVDFAAVGTGSMQINTVTPDGTDYQIAQWSGCTILGTQRGTYSDSSTWTKIVRSTTINSLAASAVDSLIQTQTTVDSAPGYDGMTVTALAKLTDGSVINAPEDYITLDQTVLLKDVGDLEEIRATTAIAGRVFDYSGSNNPEVIGQVVGETDGGNNASSLIFADLSMGEFTMDVYTRVIDDANNVETANTVFDVQVPDMSNTYNEQADGSITGYAAINGVVIDSVIATFENVDTTKVVGYLYAVTP